MPEVTLQRYQWIKGDNQGTVEIYQEDQGTFMCFASGNRCNKELVGEYMIPIYDDSEILSFTDVQDEAKVNTAKTKSSRNKMTQGLKYDDEVKTTPKPKAAPKSIPQQTTSPLVSLLEKSKKSKLKLNTRLDMQLPSKEVISVLQESFEEDILDVLSKYVVYNIKDPKTFLEKRIKASIKDWFGKKTG